MIKTRSSPVELHGKGKDCDDVGPYLETYADDQTPLKLRESSIDSVTFENFAMLLNLVNNVYIKNNTSAISTTDVIDEEEDTGTMIVRPFGYVDAQGRFMASSAAEVDMIYKKLYPLMANRRKN